MPKPATRTIPHFLILTEADSERRIAINTHTIHSFYEAPTGAGEPPVTYIHLLGDITYLVTQTPTTILSMIYNAELDDND